MNSVRMTSDLLTSPQKSINAFPPKLLIALPQISDFIAQQWKIQLWAEFIFCDCDNRHKINFTAIRPVSMIYLRLFGLRVRPFAGALKNLPAKWIRLWTFAYNSWAVIHETWINFEAIIWVLMNLMAEKKLGYGFLRLLQNRSEVIKCGLFLL